MKGLVVVTKHAQTRARERYPDVFSGEHGAMCRRIVREVSLAVDAGRMSVHLPRFAVRAGCTKRSHAGHYGNERERAMRYVWTEDEHRVYVILRHSTTVVVTCFRPDAAAFEAA